MLNLTHGSIDYYVVDVDGDYGKFSFISPYNICDIDDVYEDSDISKYLESYEQDEYGNVCEGTISIDVDWYNIGEGESRYPTTDELDYISEHKDDIIKKSELIESNTLYYDFSDL